MFVARVSELVRWNVKNGRVYAKSMAVPLQGKARKTLGSVFGVIGGEFAPKVGDSLALIIEEAFRDGLEDALLNLPVAATREDIFEAAMINVNASLVEAAAQNLPFAPDRIRAALVAQRGHEIVAAAWGDPNLLLFHPSPSNGAKIFDLLADTRGEREKALFDPAARRGFGSLIAGVVGRRDRLLISTADLRELLGAQKLTSVIVANEPESATLILRDILSPLSETLAVATVISDAVPADVQAPTQPAPGFDRSTQPQRPEQIEQAKARQRGRSMEKAKALLAACASAIRTAGLICFRLGRAAATKEGRDGLKTAVAAFRSNIKETVVNKFRSLPRRSRLLLAAILALVVTLGVGVIAAQRRSGRLEAASRLQSDVASIERMIADAEGSLLYRDNEHAREILAQAATKTAALAGDTDHLAAKENLLKKIEGRRDALRRIVPLEAPEVAASVTSTADGSASLSRIVIAGSTAWTVTAKGEIYKIALADGAAEKVGAGPAATDLPVFLPLDTGVVAGASDGRLAIARAAGGAQPATIDFGGDTPSIKDAAAFNGRLYLLDPARNRILRHPATTAGFGRGTFYLKDGTDVGSGVSMTIDGSIFVLSKDGTVTKLTKGVRDDFTVERPDPAPTSARRIRTDAIQSGLYVFDADAGRLIAYEKATGLLRAQYSSDALKSAEDAVVDERAGAIYAVSGNRVLKFSIPKTAQK
ncbi:hypothetical protein HY633_00575 [Candidatus Uhrbacteria bacterium]|nr:hypothetical protein [Candidatus Uhrbacteria bacterium]